MSRKITPNIHPEFYLGKDFTRSFIWNRNMDYFRGFNRSSSNVSSRNYSRDFYRTLLKIAQRIHLGTPLEVSTGIKYGIVLGNPLGFCPVISQAISS